MKALKLSALLLGAILFLGLGSSTLSAEGMKCGSGKCGGEKKAPTKASKCGSAKCGDEKKAPTKASKCGSGKCGDEKKAPKESMKCGAGKCGGNKQFYLLKGKIGRAHV